MNVIERIVQGDQVALRTFYDHTHKKLFAFALKHLTDFELVEEIVQESYIIIWSKKHTITPLWPVFESYLFTFIRNKCILEYKRKIEEAKALQTYQDEISIEEDPSTEFNDHYSIDQLLGVLPKQQRTVIELVKIKGLSYKEVAFHLNISERTVESHLRKAFATLRLEAHSLRLTQLLTLLMFI